MARPKKRSVDYFPHYCQHKTTLFILEQRYGNDGYAFWFKLLEFLGSSDGHFIDCNDSHKWEYLIAKVHISEDKCLEILNLLSKLQAIDSDLWITKKMIWSDNFIEGIKDAYRFRTEETPEKPSIPRGKPPESDETHVGSTQIKLNNIILNNKNIYLLDSIEVQLSELLFSLIKEKNPTHKQPNIQEWSKHIDLMLRIDKRTPDKIREIIIACQKDTFWCQNILSTKKLREKYDQLNIKLRGSHNINQQLDSAGRILKEI